MGKIKLIILNLLFIPILILALKNFCYAEEQERIFLITLPKSGTHLMIKLIALMTDKEPSKSLGSLTGKQYVKFYNQPKSYEEMLPLMTMLFNDCYKKNLYPSVHTNLAEPVLEYFLQSDQKFKKLIMIRDLRDVVISTVFFQHNIIEECTGPSTIEEKITYLLTLENDDENRFVFNIRKNALKALKIMKDDSFFVCRFEDLVGEKGGGNEELQAKTIVAIANHLEYPLNNPQLEKIIDELFGNETGPKVSVTFKDGQIGKWRSYFTEEHKRIFNARMGNLQLKLGYRLD